MEDDIYLSWIGGGFGIGVGGYSILFNDWEINLKLFEGWTVYRKILNDPLLDRMRGNQINSWNGQWLTYSMDPERYRPDFDFSELEYNNFFNIDKDVIEVNSVKWSQVFFSLSNKFPEDVKTAYIYDGFVNTNKTVGFIPFYFKSGKTILSVYNKLIDIKSFGEFKIDRKNFESLFGRRFHEAFKLGSIGLLSLRPEGLIKYMKEGKTFSIKKDEDIINYQAYKTWLLAMLSKNKEEITDYTMQMAKVIQSYRNGGKGMSRITLVDKHLFDTKSKREFLEHLTTLLTDADEVHLEEIKQLKNEIHLMTNEEFVYFSTLLKFDFTFLQRKTN